MNSQCETNILYRLITLQSEIFQAFICYNCDDYVLELMKTPNSKLE